MTNGTRKSIIQYYFRYFFKRKTTICRHTRPLLKPNKPTKLFPSDILSYPTNVNSKVMLQSLCVRALVRPWVRACVRECVSVSVRASLRAYVRAWVCSCVSECVPQCVRVCVLECVLACVLQCACVSVRACLRA